MNYVPWVHPVGMTIWLYLAQASAIFISGVILYVCIRILIALRSEPAFSPAQEQRKRHPAATACWAAKPEPGQGASAPRARLAAGRSFQPVAPVVGRKSVDGWLIERVWPRG